MSNPHSSNVFLPTNRSGLSKSDVQAAVQCARLQHEDGEGEVGPANEFRACRIPYEEAYSMIVNWDVGNMEFEEWVNERSFEGGNTDEPVLEKRRKALQELKDVCEQDKFVRMRLRLEVWIWLLTMPCSQGRAAVGPLPRPDDALLLQTSSLASIHKTPECCAPATALPVSDIRNSNDFAGMSFSEINRFVRENEEAFYGGQSAHLLFRETFVHSAK
ncbi:hypothetical protein C8R45DRAFT_937076 [Mycena sanguinolenta]|nr:hypothetical protein C8R45DRAFT_937076 [Mycena sanguinolenta]